MQPENLLLDSKGNVKVSDFGLSALRKVGTTLKFLCTKSTPFFFSPIANNLPGFLAENLMN